MKNLNNYNFKKMSIRTLLFLFYNTFIILLIVAIVTAMFIVIDKMYLMNIDSEMRMNLNSRNNTLEYILEENMELSRNISTNENLKYYMRDFAGLDMLGQLQVEQEVTRLFSGYWHGRSEIAQIKVFTYGKKYTATNINSICQLEEIENDPLFSTYLELNTAFITEYTLQLMNVSYAPFEERMAIINRIVDYDDKTLGYLFVEIYKKNLYDRLRTETGSSFFVVNNNGQYVLCSDESNYNKFLDDIKMNRQNELNGFGKTDISYEGVPSTAFFSSTSKHGWKVVEIKSHSELFGWRKMLIIAFFVFVMLVAYISWLFSKKIAGLLIFPVIKLSEKMNSFDKINDNNVYGKEIELLYKQYNILLIKQAALLKETREKSENQKKAEINALVAQINPHFLFNTLNSIGYSALAIDAKEIVSMISKLGKICHISYNMSSLTTTLMEELDHVALYMDLQKECFENKFEYEIEILPELESVIIPKFILQPVVENAILHGFYQINREGRLKISVRRSDTLQIMVHDNGTGITESILKKLNAHTYKSEKYGVRNVNERIQLICGEEMSYGIEYKSNGYSYTTAIITLPIGGCDV